MSKYDAQNFIDALNQKTPNEKLICPFCGSENFSTIKEFASIFIGEEMSKSSIGQAIPAGILFCQNCGHLDFFALGVLNLISPKEEEKDNGK